MFDKAGKIVIIDFGASDLCNMKNGTENYYAPEQFEHHVLAHGMDARKLDSWSLG